MRSSRKVARSLPFGVHQPFHCALPGASAHLRPDIAQRHFRIFAAYLFPDVSVSGLYQSITPVKKPATLMRT